MVPAGTEMFNALVGPSYNKRLDEWKQEIAEQIRQAAQAGRIDIESLPQNERFIDAVTQATMIAVSTSQVEKRRALRNAVLNAASSSTVDATQQQIFLSLIDRMSEHHILLLKLFDAPGAWRDSNGRGAAGFTAVELAEKAFPESKRDPELFDQLWSDLYSWGLVRTPKIDNGLEGSVENIRRTKAFAQRFLAFIRDPI